jgi:hypothetical protein
MAIRAVEDKAKEKKFKLSITMKKSCHLKKKPAFHRLRFKPTPTTHIGAHPMPPSAYFKTNQPADASVPQQT